MSRLPRLVQGVTASVITWSFAAVALHLAFLILAASANGWTLKPLIQAHDGVYYLSHLQDPMLGSPPEWWDNVPYRGARLGYVFLALPFRWLGGIPALVIVNLIALVAGLHAIRHIARRHAASERVAGILWIVNPGALVCTALLLPDTLAWTALLLALIAIDEDRWVPAAVFSILAVTTKEASIGALAIPAFMMWRAGRRMAMGAVAVAGVWHISVLAFLVARFGPSFHDSFVTWPLWGWFGSFRWWWDGHTIDGLVALLALAGGVAVMIAFWSDRSLYLGAAAGQALLLLALAPVVVAPMANTTRVAGLFWPLLAATHRLASSAPIENSRAVNSHRPQNADWRP